MAARAKGGRPKRFSRFDLRALFARWLLATFLVFAVYNPSGTSLFHWMRDSFGEAWMLQIPLVVLLSILYFLLLRATILALRVIGMTIIVAILGSLVWVLSDLGLVDLQRRVELELAVLLVVSGLLTAGVSSMHVLTRLSGQANIDDITDP